MVITAKIGSYDSVFQAGTQGLVIVEVPDPLVELGMGLTSVSI